MPTRSTTRTSRSASVTSAAVTSRGASRPRCELLDGLHAGEVRSHEARHGQNRAENRVLRVRARDRRRVERRQNPTDDVENRRDDEYDSKHPQHSRERVAFHSPKRSRAKLTAPATMQDRKSTRLNSSH